MATPPVPNDPLFPTQWGLLNTGQQGGHVGADINLLPVLGTGPGQVTGTGVRVAVIDDGTQLDQPDLVANIDAAASYDSVRNTIGNGSGGPTDPGQNHGTAVAGIIGAAENGIGSVGVAPGATLVIERIPLGNDPLYSGEGSDESVPTQQDAITNAINYALTANADLASNSWGNGAPFVNDFGNNPNLTFGPALKALATQGRAGKGASFVVANGNDRTDNANGTLNGLTNSRFSIAVAAVDNNGSVSSYSTPGADLLVAAPGGASTPQRPGQPGTGTTTADRTGTDGYNAQPSPDGDATYAFNGTSAATPFVSGVVALMLQANPNLGYRDIQQILACSARLTDPSGTRWLTNGAQGVNGGGLHFNLDYGFGMVDAHGAVRLAQTWGQLGYAPQDEANVTSVTGNAAPATPEVIGTGNTLTVSLGVGRVEHLDLNLGLTVADASRIGVYLTSPSGTTVALAPFAGPAGTPYPGTFQLGTDAFWGEQAAGDWTITIRTRLLPTNTLENNPGTINSAVLQAYGGAGATTNQLIYTDDFALMAAASAERTVVTGGPGIDTFNAAATSGPLVLDLGTRTGAIGGQAVTVAAGSSFKTVIGGDGLDILRADGGNYLFTTGYGQSFVALGSGTNQVVSRGQDTIAGGAGTGTVFAQGTSLVAVAGTGALTMSGQASSDTVFAGAGGGVLFGGSSGKNILVGGAGLAGTTVVGGGAGDLLFAQGPANTVLSAGTGNETLSGGASIASNTIFAGAGNDVIGGGSGADTIFAGSGNATVDGGAGADLFVFANGRAGGSMLINNFSPAERVALTGYAPGELAADLARAVLNTTTAPGVTIMLSDKTQVTFAGLTTLKASMFI